MISAALSSRADHSDGGDPATADDLFLLKRIQKGDPEAFGELYDKYRDALYCGVILPRTHDRELAEDALHDTFVTALNKIGGFKWQGIGFFPWLKRIAVLKCKEVLRKSRKEAPLNEEFLNILPDARQYMTPERVYLRNEMRADLRSRLDGIMALLNERYREALDLRLVKELSREECARRFEITINNFDVLFFRACRSFVKKYREQYGEAPAELGRLRERDGDDED